MGVPNLDQVVSNLVACKFSDKDGQEDLSCGLFTCRKWIVCDHQIGTPDEGSLVQSLDNLGLRTFWRP